MKNAATWIILIVVSWAALTVGAWLIYQLALLIVGWLT